MKKIKIGIFGPNGRMGKDLIEQIKSFNSLELSFLCEKKNHTNIGKKASLHRNRNHNIVCDKELNELHITHSSMAKHLVAQN